MPSQRHTANHGHSRLPRPKKSGDEDPKMIGHWKIGRTIGKGSSGRVKIARHVKTHQYAAIKIISKNALIHSRMSMADAPSHVEKVLLGIEREIVIMKLIDHPNVLNLYDVWETGNELYLIMEYVEGGELFDYLVSRGRLPASEALHYFQQVIFAISYCHGFNIAHRDLKPENLLLSKSGSSRNIKVADFGMAAYTDPATMLATSCGSPHYASPEVIEGRAYKGNVSDIWSCGVILYALLSGRLPFDDENLRILLEKVKMATYETPTDIPPFAQDLIARMLQKDVTQRITMSQILRHPFFVSSTPSPALLLEAQMPTLDQLSCSIDKPVQSEEDIDADIFDNLRTLWHGAPVQEIIENLLNDEKTWEKAVYHLLLKYRSRHLENYNMEEGDVGRGTDVQDQITQGSQLLYVDERLAHVNDPTETIREEEGKYKERGLEKTADTRRQDCPEDPVSTYIARPSAPTPQRAVCYGDAMILESDSNVFISTPRHARVGASPVVPRCLLPSLGPDTDTDTDIFTTISRRSPANTSPRSRALLLPTPSTPLTTAESALATNVQKARPMSPEVTLTYNRTSPPTPSLPLAPSPMLELPLLDIPNLQDVDVTVQRFFHQIMGHLKTMQMQQMLSTNTFSGPAIPDHSPKDTRARALTSEGAAMEIRERVRNEVPPPPPTTPALPEVELISDESRFADALDGSEAPPPTATDPPVLGLGISDHHLGAWNSHPAPLPPLQQQIQPVPPPRRASSKARYDTNKKLTPTDKWLHIGDKENVGVRKSKIKTDSPLLRKKSSLRSNQSGKKTLVDKHVQIRLPLEEDEASLKKRKSILPTRSGETSPALSDGSFFLPAESAPKKSWFSNLFNFKPASYNLLSVHDAYTTREECARLFRTFGVAVLLTNSEGNGVLKCKLEEIRDPAGIMAVAKAVQFRVELHAVTHAHSVSGYVSSLTMVQEKGALSSFKLIYNRLRREWDLDTPPSARTPGSTYGLLSNGRLSGVV